MVVSVLIPLIHSLASQKFFCYNHCTNGPCCLIDQEGVTLLNIKDMEFIIAVMDEGNITRAAKKLFVTQSALSQCIQRVESELNTTLFNRTKNGIELTNSGQTFFTYADRICKNYQDLGTTLADISNLKTGYLTVGIPALMNGYILPRGYMSYREKYPNIRVDLFESDSSHLETMLLRGKIDLAIMSLPVDASLVSYPMLSSEMQICAPEWFEPGDALIDPEHRILDIRKLENQPFIFPRQHQKLHKVTERILKKAGITVQNVLNTRSSTGALLYSSLGLGFTIQPAISIQFYLPTLHEKANIYRIAPQYNENWNIVLARSRNSYFSKAAQSFIETMQEYYAQEDIG